MELVTLEELEQQLTTITDPDERRRLRGKIRRMRRRQGLGTSVSVTRVSSRNRNPYAAETIEDSEARFQRDAPELGLMQLAAGSTFMLAVGYPRQCDLQAAVEAHMSSRGHPPTHWTLARVRDDAMLALGTI